MNSDRKFVKTLRDVLKQAKAHAEKTFPENAQSQNNYIVGWLESEAGISENNFYEEEKPA